MLSGHRNLDEKSSAPFSFLSCLADVLRRENTSLLTHSCLEMRINQKLVANVRVGIFAMEMVSQTISTTPESTAVMF